MFQWRSVSALFASAIVLCTAGVGGTAQAAEAPRTDSHLSSSEYKALVETIFEEFLPDSHRHDARISLQFHENSSGTGAFTWRKDGGRTWEFHFYDGVLKIKNMTTDVLTLIVCHELGHHLAGYPFKEESTWSAAEGQADYFATQACVPRLWQHDSDKNAVFAKRVGAESKKECDASFLQQPRRDICYRTMTALEAARFYEGRNERVLPDLRRSDGNVVNRTQTDHASAQCRIDTQKAGAICAREFDFSFVPGIRFPAKNSIESEMESALSVCSGADFPLSAQRPRCWFAPLAGGVN
ncbi:MAG: hypothetical protein RIR26_520 [Pseudomonadota bacterium]